MDVFMGSILAFGFNFAPLNWATCSGQIMSISQNSALFALLGTYYGGNGTSTFGLPDLRGRMAISMGQGPGLPNYSIGELSGTTQVTLLSNNLPPHNHMMMVNGGNGTTARPGGAFLAAGVDANAVAVQVYAPTNSGATLNPQAISMTGQSIPFSIMPPYLAINYCIALYGIFPSRN